MDFGTLVAAAVGAVIGIGSTLMTDSVRARRDLDQKWVDTKRLVYVRFLEALAQAHSRITVAALQGLAGAERRQAVHHAFHNDQDIRRPSQFSGNWRLQPPSTCIDSQLRFTNVYALLVTCLPSHR